MYRSQHAWISYKTKKGLENGERDISILTAINRATFWSRDIDNKRYNAISKIDYIYLKNREEEYEYLGLVKEDYMTHDEKRKIMSEDEVKQVGDYYTPKIDQSFINHGDLNFCNHQIRLDDDHIEWLPYSLPDNLFEEKKPLDKCYQCCEKKKSFIKCLCDKRFCEECNDKDQLIEPCYYCNQIHCIYCTQYSYIENEEIYKYKCPACVENDRKEGRIALKCSYCSIFYFNGSTCYLCEKIFCPDCYKDDDIPKCDY